MAVVLPQEAARLVRLVFHQLDNEVSRSMAGILKTLSAGPIRITDLARAEGLTQPTATALVRQGESKGWIRRSPDPSDGRVVFASITPAGRGARRRLHTAIRGRLKEHLKTLSDEELGSVLEATNVIAVLNQHLLQ